MTPAAVFLGMLLAQPAAAAPSGGTWSRTVEGGSISTGQQLLRGRAIMSPQTLPASASAVRLSWRITLLSPPPPGLEIKLCRSDHCFQLPALVGQRPVDIPLSAAGEFRFIYTVKQPGQLRPTLNIVSQQLTVNYR